jgi:hypothetical protein
MSPGHQACPELVEGTADWVLDLGPEGGDKGGEIVAEGTPEQVAKESRSYTGGYLAPLLKGKRGAPQELAMGEPEARFTAKRHSVVAE